MTSPLGPCWLVNVYGEPIYTEGKTDEQVAEEVKFIIRFGKKLQPEKFKEAKEIRNSRKTKKIPVSMLQNVFNYW